MAVTMALVCECFSKNTRRPSSGVRMLQGSFCERVSSQEDSHSERSCETRDAVSLAKGSRGLVESTEVTEVKRTLCWAFLAARFSWCLSRRLRNRETPFMLAAGSRDTHSGGWMAAAGVEKTAEQVAGGRRLKGEGRRRRATVQVGEIGQRSGRRRGGQPRGKRACGRAEELPGNGG